MDETITLDALTQFLYHEMPAEDAYLTTQILSNNAELRATYTEMLTAKAQLPKVLFSPSTDCLNRIRQYSAQSRVECV
jgi:hypothetical protein